MADFLRLLQVCAASVVVPGNPVPDLLETPNSPGGAGASLKRLEEGSGGKTPTVKNFALDWVRSLAERGELRVYTRENSKNFEYIGLPVGAPPKVPCAIAGIELASRSSPPICCSCSSR